jgi:hypothetical protein
MFDKILEKMAPGGRSGNLKNDAAIARNPVNPFPA